MVHAANGHCQVQLSLSVQGEDVKAGHLREEQAALRKRRRAEQASAAASKHRAVASAARSKPVAVPPEPSPTHAKSTEAVCVPPEPSPTDAKSTEPPEPSPTEAKSTEPVCVPPEPSPVDAKSTEPVCVPPEPSQGDAKSTELTGPERVAQTIRDGRRRAQEEKARRGLQILQEKADSLPDCRSKKQALSEMDPAELTRLTLV